MARVIILNLSILLSLFISFNVVKCNVPVLLWESTSISDKDDLIPSLYQLDSDEFSNHIVKKIRQHKPLVVLFLEESLSVEDFSWKDYRGKGSFSKLQNITGSSAKTEFITSVYDPISALQDLAESQEYKWVKYDDKKLPKSNSVLVVNMEEPGENEDRPDLLSRHDANIADIFSQLQSKYSNILAIFTGKYSSWVEPEYNRVRRDVNDNSTSAFDLSATYGDNTHTRVVSSAPVVLTEKDGRQTNLTEASDVKLDNPKNSRSIIGIFPDNKKIRFKFSSNGRTWTLMSIVVNDNLTFNIDTISKPIGVPYVSSKPVEFSNGTSKLTFQDIQVQAWMDTKMFGDKPPVYFTYPILMGIFVTVILGLILSWAIIMMMDIRTMDRFDDPKGKTITVVQEG